MHPLHKINKIKYQNRQLNCRRRSRLSVCPHPPPPAQPGVSRDVQRDQTRLLNRQEWFRLATGTQNGRKGCNNGSRQVRSPTTVNWTPVPCTCSSGRATAWSGGARRAGGPEEEGDFPVDATTYVTPHRPTSPTRWDLPCQPASRTWQNLPEDMGSINIGLVEDRNHTALVLTHCTSRWLSTGGWITEQPTSCWGRSLETATGSWCKALPAYGSAVLGSSLTAPPHPPPPPQSE